MPNVRISDSEQAYGGDHVICASCGMADPPDMVDIGKTRELGVCAGCYFALMEHMVKAERALNPLSNTLTVALKGKPH
jgi:hypothetical protein